jgi:hypothetical protein
LFALRNLPSSYFLYTGAWKRSSLRFYDFPLPCIIYNQKEHPLFVEDVAPWSDYEASNLIAAAYYRGQGEQCSVWWRPSLRSLSLIQWRYNHHEAVCFTSGSYAIVCWNRFDCAFVRITKQGYLHCTGEFMPCAQRG